MERLDHIFTLNELLENTQERQAERPEEPLYQDLADALQAGIESLEKENQNKQLHHKILISLGCLFAALGLFATVCGMGYVLLGHLAAAHQMAPYAGILAILSVLSCWAVKA